MGQGVAALRVSVQKADVAVSTHGAARLVRTAKRTTIKNGANPLLSFF